MILEQEFNIPMTKNIESEVDDMCNLSEGVYNRGFEDGAEYGVAQGAEQNELQCIKNIMKNLKMTVEQAMEILNVATEKRESYKSIL